MMNIWLILGFICLQSYWYHMDYWKQCWTALKIKFKRHPKTIILNYK